MRRSLLRTASSFSFILYSFSSKQWNFLFSLLSFQPSFFLSNSRVNLFVEIWTKEWANIWHDFLSCKNFLCLIWGWWLSVWFDMKNVVWLQEGWKTKKGPWNFLYLSSSVKNRMKIFQETNSSRWSDEEWWTSRVSSYKGCTPGIEIMWFWGRWSGGFKVEMGKIGLK